MAKPKIATSSSGLRRQPCVAAVSGIAVASVPKAYSVTSWPISASDTRRSAPICGIRPAGKASVSTVMNAAIARASSPAMGSRSGRKGMAPCAEIAEVMKPPFEKLRDDG